MRRHLLALLATVVAVPAGAQSYSNPFQDPATAFAGAQDNRSGEIAESPVGGTALHFTANSSGHDYISPAIIGSGSGRYRLTIDYFCADAGGCGGYVGLSPSFGTTPGSSDAWLATDTQGAFGTPFTLVTGTNAFATNTFTFDVSATGQFGVKLEDYSNGVSGGGPGNAYFRNLSITAVPEPATWAMMLVGFGMIGFGLRRRAKQSVRVTYA